MKILFKNHITDIIIVYLGVTQWSHFSKGPLLFKFMRLFVNDMIQIILLFILLFNNETSNWLLASLSNFDNCVVIIYINSEKWSTWTALRRGMHRTNKLGHLVLHFGLFLLVYTQEIILPLMSSLLLIICSWLSISLDMFLLIMCGLNFVMSDCRFTLWQWW